MIQCCKKGGEYGLIDEEIEASRKKAELASLFPSCKIKSEMYLNLMGYPEVQIVCYSNAS
jgi:hypothetical protein